MLLENARHVFGVDFAVLNETMIELTRRIKDQREKIDCCYFDRGPIGMNPPKKVKFDRVLIDEFFVNKPTTVNGDILIPSEYVDELIELQLKRDDLFAKYQKLSKPDNQ